jgi:hypothetical protein
LAACASPNSTVEADLAGNNDMAMQVIPDLARAADGPNLCNLGDPDHCGTCTTVCPPGQDDGGTLRTCSAATAFGKCDYQCRGEYYDIDGKIANGCEAQDLPIQDSPATAVVKNLADGALIPSPSPDGTNPINFTGQVFGDVKDHETPPTQRPNGREDWYKVMATGNGDGAKNIEACLGITNFPTDNMFEICLSTSATFTSINCKTVTGGGASMCVAPAIDGTATYYVRVRRLSGATYTSNQYALYIDH